MSVPAQSGITPEHPREAAETEAAGEAPDLWVVQAIVQPFRLDDIVLALEALPGFGGMTVVECRGFGREKAADLARQSRAASEGDDRGADRGRELGVESLTDFTRKVLLEAAVAGREHADAVVAAIGQAAHTGRRGDGKIFVWPLARAMRIATFEENERAL